MKNKTTEIVTRNVEVIQSITCNKCGKAYEPDDDEEFMHIHKVDIRFDGEYNYFRSKCWWFDLCDECLIEIVKTFKFAPDWFKGSIGKYAQKEFEEWVNDGCQLMDRH